MPFLADIFERRGAEEYLGEPVTIAEHMLQGAWLAEEDGASDELVAAALLHDIGHFTSEFGTYSPDDIEDKHHDEAGAEVLAPFFPPVVTECVRLHVAAKRYLCATDPSYFAKLSPASVHTLSLQGGPMSDAEVAEFSKNPFHDEAVRVRIWDEGGKVPGMKTRRLRRIRAAAAARRRRASRASRRVIVDRRPPFAARRRRHGLGRRTDAAPGRGARDERGAGARAGDAADGSFAVMVFSERGDLIREIALAGARRMISRCIATSGRAVVFARRPGTFAVAFDIFERVAPQVFVARPDRHFFGHGAYSADGKLLFATENDFAAGEGVIGIYDATDAYKRIGEFPTRGVGTHEAILLPDGKTLAIANGGIETHPEYGREMLNIPTMDPSLAFVDLDGHLIAQYRLPRDIHQLSIRHMAVGADGKIWFGTQWEGDPLETPSLVGRASLEGGLELVAMPSQELNDMRRYVGAMAASRDGTLISASAPRGGYVVHFSAETRPLCRPHANRRFKRHHRLWREERFSPRTAKG